MVSQGLLEQCLEGWCLCLRWWEAGMVWGVSASIIESYEVWNSDFSDIAAQHPFPLLSWSCISAAGYSFLLRRFSVQRARLIQAQPRRFEGRGGHVYQKTFMFSLSAVEPCMWQRLEGTPQHLPVLCGRPAWIFHIGTALRQVKYIHQSCWLCLMLFCKQFWMWSFLYLSTTANTSLFRDCLIWMSRVYREHVLN